MHPCSRRAWSHETMLRSSREIRNCLDISVWGVCDSSVDPDSSRQVREDDLAKGCNHVFTLHRRMQSNCRRAPGCGIDRVCSMKTSIQEVSRSGNGSHWPAVHWPFVPFRSASTGGAYIILRADSDSSTTVNPTVRMFLDLPRKIV